MSRQRDCPACGAELPAGVSPWLCPRCLLRQAANHAADEPAASSASEPAGPTPSATPGEVFPQPFGAYELLERIGQGGMGLVYRARQISLDRIVAVKVLPHGVLATREQVLRFRTEASAAGSLRHPNIVAIHEVGLCEERHYLVMDSIEGRTLAEVIANSRFQISDCRRAARYVQIIAEAVHHAHEHGILHRDLKPSNVLIDADDQPRITDFGLAKRLESGSDLTLSGQVLGSPQYMPPEQAAGRHRQVGRRSDVYALGAILYHLLTGRPPFVGETVSDILPQVANDEPLRPRQVNPAVPADLETICLKCLEKEMPRRYPTALALAEELGRFLSGNPILARPIGVMGKVWRWCRRNPALAASGAAINLLLAAMAVGGLMVAQRQHTSAETYRRLLYASDMKAAQQAYELGNMQDAVTFLERHPVGTREFTWRYLNRLCRPHLTTPELSHTSHVFYLVAPRDGKRLAVGGGTDWVGIWDVEARSKIREFRTGEPWVTGPLGLSPDGRYIVATGLRPEWTTNGMQIWDTTTLHSNPPWTPVYRRPGFFGAYSDFSPDGSRLAVPSANEIVLIEAGGNWEEIGRLTGHAGWVWSARFSLDGRQLVTASEDATARVWDVATRQCLGVFTNHTAGLHAAAFSPDARQIASVSYDKTVRLWDAESLQQEGGYDHNVGLNALDFCPDRWLIASGGADGSVKVWDVGANTIRTLRGHSQYVMAVKFVLGGTRLASGSWDHTVKFWNLDKSVPNDVIESSSRGRSPFAFSMDGRLLATVSSNASEILLWDTATGAPATARAGVLTNRLGSIVDARSLLSAKEAADDVAMTNVILTDLAFSPHDGALAAVRGFDVILAGTESRRHRIEFWDVGRGTMSSSFEGQMPVRFSPDGRLIACQGPRTGTILIRDLATGRAWTAEQKIPTMEQFDMAFSPDSQTLVSSGMTTFLWETASGKRLATLSDYPNSPINALAFAPDGKGLIAGGATAEVQIWELSSGRRITLRGHVTRVTSLAVSPDGRTLASADSNGLIKLWRLERERQGALAGRELLTLRQHQDSVDNLQFSLDGSVLASGSTDGTVRLWRAGN